MKINETNIKNITVEEFNKLLDSIGIVNLRQNLIKVSKDFPKTSIYYTSNRGDGSFWSGFRKETFPKNKIDSFYVEEIYYNKTKLNLYDNFSELLSMKYIINENDANFDSVEDIDTKIILSKIFAVDISPDDLNESLKKHLEEKYQNIIDNLESEYEEKINNLIEKKEREKMSEITSLENKYKKIMLELQNKIKEKEDSNKKLLKYEKLINKILNEVKVQEDIDKFILEKQISSVENIKEILKKGFENIINILDSDEDISRLIVKQYIIYKLMKE